MTRDIVNVVPSASAPPPASTGAQSRGKGFEDLIRAKPGDEDETSSEPEKTASASLSGVAALLGVPGFFAQAAIALDAGEAGSVEVATSPTPAAVIPPETPAKTAPVTGNPGTATATATATPAEVRSAKATAEGRAPVATLAAALQAQADGFATARTASQSANEALAASGVVRLHGASTPGDLTLGAPAGQAVPVATDLKAPVEGKQGKAEGGKSDRARAGAPNSDVPEAEVIAAKSSVDPDAEIPETAEIKGSGAGASSGSAPAPADRIQTLQTSAAPATPSAQSAQPVVSGSVAAAVQVANEIASHAASRRSRFEIQLDPGDLGRVDVRLDIAHDGRVATRLIVERPETLDMLRNDARELSRTLEQAGFQLGQGGLAFQLKDGRQAFWANDAETTRSAAADEIDEVAPVAAAYSRSLSAPAGGVDVKV